MKKVMMFLIVLFSAMQSFASVHLIKEVSTLPDDPRKLYIDLMIKAVANTIYEDPSFAGTYVAGQRQVGYDHPSIAHTMIGVKRLQNIQFCMEQILQNQIPGDCIETGVWRGGATILMRAILKAYGDKTRKVWVADSFQGIPPPNAEKYPADTGLFLSGIPYIAVSLEKVQDNFRKYDLLDHQVIFLKGFFCDTLPTAPIGKLALLRLDGDLYESTILALENLYPKLSIGGYVIVDDYGAIGACSQAIKDYRAKNNIQDELISIDFTGVYWKKTK